MGVILSLYFKITPPINHSFICLTEVEQSKEKKKLVYDNTAAKYGLNIVTNIQIHFTQFRTCIAYTVSSMHILMYSFVYAYSFVDMHTNTH